MGLGGLIQHLAELGAVGNPAALGLVHVLAEDHVAVLGGVVPECSELCGNRVVHVLPVAGDSSIKRCWHKIELAIHRSLLPVSSWSVV